MGKVTIVFLCMFFLISPIFTQEVTASEKVKLEKITANAGVLFRPEHEVVFTTDTWTISFQFSLVPMKNSFKRLKDYFEEWKKINMKLIQDEVVLQLDSLFNETQEEFLGLFLHDSFEAEKIEKTEKARVKRGYVDAVGSLSKTLFGTATSEDIRNVNLKMRKVEYEIGKEGSLISQQVTVLHDLQMHEKLQDNRMNATIAALKGLFDSIKSMTSLTDEHREGEGTLRSAVLIYYNHLLSGINLFRTQVNFLKQVQSQLLNGYLDRFLISNEKLYSVLEKIQLSLSDRARFVLPLHQSSIRNYYQWRLVTFLPVEGTIKGILHVPLMDLESSFTLFNVVPFPTPLNASLPEYRVQLNTKTKYLAVTPDHSKFVELEFLDYHQCYQGPILLCPLVHAYNLADERSCIFDIFTNRSLYQATDCVFTPIIKEKIFIEPISKSHWILSLGQSEVVKIACQRFGTENRVLKATSDRRLVGIYQTFLPHSCKLNVGSNEIPIRTAFDEKENEIDIEVKNKVLNFPQMKLEKLPDIIFQNSTWNNPKLEKLINQLIPLQVNDRKQLDRDMSLLDVESALSTKTNIAFSDLPWEVNIFQVLTLICFVGSISLCIYVFRQRIREWRINQGFWNQRRGPITYGPPQYASPTSAV